MIVEICANSFESAKAAQDGGADRIELCSELSVGGLTPSYDLMKKVVAELSLPVHVLIRPRSGDFIYTVKELDQMVKDIAYCKSIGCTGIVSGVLTSGATIDVPASKQLIEASKGMEFTFHRAFDCVHNPEKQLRFLIDLEVTRLLSSGKQVNAIDGIDLLKKFKKTAKGAIEIMPGGGITAENAFAFKEDGFEMIHLSATRKVKPTSTELGLFTQKVLGSSNRQEIERIIKILS